MTATRLKEKDLQETFEWSRSTFHTEYNMYLAYYKVIDALEHAKGDSLLDLACGDGTLTASMEKHFRRVVGVDASGKHLAEAKKRLPHLTFVESLIEELDIDEKFSTVTMMDVLEHVEDPVFTLKKAASFLADDGVMIVHVPNAEAVNRKIAVLMGTLTHCEELSPFDINVAGHRRSYVLDTLTKDMEAAGLEVVTAGGIFYKMMSTPQIDWFLKNGEWTSGHGWGRTGQETAKDWKAEFCRACYEYGKQNPRDCNIIYTVVRRKKA